MIKDTIWSLMEKLVFIAGIMILIEIIMNTLFGGSGSPLAYGLFIIFPLWMIPAFIIIIKELLKYYHEVKASKKLLKLKSNILKLYFIIVIFWIINYIKHVIF